MLYSLKVQGAGLGKMDFLFSVFNATVAFFFVTMFYEDPAQSTDGVMFRAVVISGALGFAMGLYFKYRSKLSSLHAVGTTACFVIVMEILFFASVSGLACTIAGRSDLRWLGFNTFAACMLLTLLIGMLLEANRLGLLKGDSRWREEIGKYLDYSKRLVDPVLTAKPDVKSPSMGLISLGAALGVNVPLLFKAYTGDMNNVIYSSNTINVGYAYLYKF